MKTRPLSREEVHRIASFLDPLLKMLLQTGVCTGFRISELLSITPSDITKSGALFIDASRTKTRMPRTVPLHPECLKSLQRYIRRNRIRRHQLLFPISRIKAWREIKKASVLAGIDPSRIGTHSMRKTFAARIFEQNPSVDLVKLALGHTEIGSTLRYLEDESGFGLATVFRTVDFF